MNIESLTNHLCFEQIFERNKNDDGTYNWLKISKEPDLPVSFIDKYFFQINSYGFLERQNNLSTFIIKKYGNFLNWNLLLINQDIQEDILLQFEHKINWKICSTFQDLSYNFIIKNIDKINMKDLEKNIKINLKIKLDVKNYLASLET